MPFCLVVGDSGISCGFDGFVDCIVAEAVSSNLLLGSNWLQEGAGGRGTVGETVEVRWPPWTKRKWKTLVLVEVERGGWIAWEVVEVAGDCTAGTSNEVTTAQRRSRAGRGSEMRRDLNSRFHHDELGWTGEASRLCQLLFQNMGGMPVAG